MTSGEIRRRTWGLMLLALGEACGEGGKGPDAGRLVQGMGDQDYSRLICCLVELSASLWAQSFPTPELSRAAAAELALDFASTESDDL